MSNADANPFDSAPKPRKVTAQTDDDGVKRDRYGRYVLPHPDTRVEQGWTRVTTLAKSASDTFNLDRWGLRMAMKGLMMRPDLQAMVASTPFEDKDKLNQLGEDAKEAGGSKVRANLGTALHKFSESVDRDPKTLATVGEAWRGDIEAYRDALAEHRIEVVPEYIERICIAPEVEAAGTFDRVLRLPNGELVIGDLKTGEDLQYGWLEIAIQLAVYANAVALWNKETEQWEPMPPVSKVKAIVMHLPVGKNKCTLYWVNVKVGWQGAQLCYTVREWRRTRNVHKPIEKRRI